MVECRSYKWSKCAGIIGLESTVVVVLNVLYAAVQWRGQNFSLFDFLTPSAWFGFCSFYMLMWFTFVYAFYWLAEHHVYGAYCSLLINLTLTYEHKPPSHIKWTDSNTNQMTLYLANKLKFHRLHCTLFSLSKFEFRRWRNSICLAFCLTFVRHHIKWTHSNTKQMSFS